MKTNTLQNAAEYALMIMEGEQSRRSVSLGFDCAVSMLRDALGKSDADDERNLWSVGVRSIQGNEGKNNAPISSIPTVRMGSLDNLFNLPNSSLVEG